MLILSSKLQLWLFFYGLTSEMNALGLTRAEALTASFQFNYSTGVVVMH